MGMDLVAVYAQKASDHGPGTIKINPSISNNLGVRTTVVENIPLTHDIKTVGFVRYDETKFIHIHPRVAGWVEKLHVKSSGDPVKKGQALYALYSPELVNAQQEFIAELNRNHAQLISAAEQRLRALQLSPKTIEELKRSRTIKQTVTFYSPQDGVVDNLNIREGFYAQPNTPIMSIGSLAQVWVEAEVFERQSHLVKTGQKVAMTLDFLPNQTWYGKVDYIYPSLDAKNRTLRARLKFENKKRLLKPNMFAQIIIYGDKQDSHLAVPKESVIRTGKQDRVVLALGNGQFKSVAIKIGSITDEYIEVLAGLSEGEKIVSSAQFLLDSESSKNSDFKRLSHPIEHTTATVNGTINSINTKTNSINISREAIDKWQRPKATMDFDIEKNIEIAALNNNDHVQFTFSIVNGRFVINRIKKIKANIKSSDPSAIMDHSKMDHSNMKMERQSHD